MKYKLLHVIQKLETFWVKLHNSLGFQTMSRLVVFNVAGAGGTTVLVAAAVVVVTTVARVDTVPAVLVELCLGDHLGK